MEPKSDESEKARRTLRNKETVIASFEHLLTHTRDPEKRAKFLKSLEKVRENLKITSERF